MDASLDVYENTTRVGLESSRPEPVAKRRAMQSCFGLSSMLQDLALSTQQAILAVRGQVTVLAQTL